MVVSYPGGCSVVRAARHSRQVVVTGPIRRFQRSWMSPYPARLPVRQATWAKARANPDVDSSPAPMMVTRAVPTRWRPSTP
ncbi:Uncharacterised protein [Mycobacteroides abscessus subsp. abscessus]|nr:Uncharacterised protein [Mycobacteroides abscessus subsp. abscessus]